MALRWTVVNSTRAVADAPDQPWNDLVVLSDDAVLGGGDDRQIAQVAHTGGLQRGASYTVAIDEPIGPLTPAPRHLFLIVASGAVYEYEYEANNIAGPVSVDILGPDLRVDAAVTAPSAQFGETISLTYRVANTGSAETVGKIEERYWLSPDGSLTGALLLGSHISHGSSPDPAGRVLVGGSYTETIAVRIPPSATLDSGSYFVVIQADSASDQAETNEANNDLALPILLRHPPVPDLHVVSVAAPEPWQPGQSATVEWVVENRGDAAAAGNWVDAIMLSPDGTTSNAVTLASVTRQGGLGVADSYTASQPVVLPPMADGSYRVFVITDTNNAVYERAAEDNNRALAPAATLVTHPDLTPTALQAPAAVVSGSSATVRWTVTNAGTGSASVPWVDRLYLSQDTVVDPADVLLAEVKLTERLAPGSSATLERLVTLPLELSGSYHLILSTDAGQQLIETGAEDNNQRSSVLTLDLAPYADLLVSDVVAPTLTIGDPVQVTVAWTVRNQGTGVGRQTQWTDAVVASTDAKAGNADDVVLGRFPHAGALEVGASDQRQETILLPPAFAGRYRLFVITDADNVVFENEQEANNAAAAPDYFDVMTIPYADLVVTSVQTPPVAFSSTAMTLTWSVENQGIGLTSATAWSDSVWLATDAAGQNRVSHLGAFDHIGALAPAAATREAARSCCRMACKVPTTPSS